MGYTLEWVAPSWFSIGGIEIQNFGLCIGLAFLSAGKIADIEFRRLGVGVDTGELLLIAMISGVAGARVHTMFSDWMRGDDPGNLFAGGGLSFQGGFITATICIWLYVKVWHRMAFARCMDSMAPALVIGYAVGKVGCFVSGDGCYGAKTKLPWGMAFPNALVPTRKFVHPAPLYEFVANTILVIFLMRRARATRIPVLNNVGMMLMWLGTLRFLMEYCRGHPLIILGLFTEYQGIAFGIAFVGFCFFTFSLTAYSRTVVGPPAVPEDALPDDWEPGMPCASELSAGNVAESGTEGEDTVQSPKAASSKSKKNKKRQ